MDSISKERRSWNMSRIKGKDTTPEINVRYALHRLGYRFRLHRRDLPGNPDIVLPRYKIIIFVHGCFWHRHHMCKYAYTPKSRKKFWQKKFKENVFRDKLKQKELENAGWRVFVIWECETKNAEQLQDILKTIMVSL